MAGPQWKRVLLREFVSCGLIRMREEVGYLEGGVSERRSGKAFVPGVPERCTAGEECEKRVSGDWSMY
jgi:hypothetical protein